MTKCGALTLVLVTMLGASCSAANVSGILVPAYFYPAGNTYWDDLAAAAAKVPIIAILNPNSGPGATADSNYTAACAKLRAAGGSVIGYVSTGYNRGTRTLNVIEADIDKYYAWYALDGIFLDEMTNDDDEANLSFYAALYAYIKTKASAAVVVGNPGTNTVEAYLTRPAADKLVIFENNTVFKKTTPASWVKNHDRAQFCVLPYQAGSPGKMRNCIALARKRNIGFIYVTDDGKDGNPWDRLPSYWAKEVSAVKAALPRRTAPKDAK